MAESEIWIRQRAYALWEEEGYPHGKDAEHWERAKQEYLLFGKPAQGAKDTPTSRRKADKPVEAPIVDVQAKPVRSKAAATKKAAVAEEAPKPIPKRRPKKTEATS